ncbi:MAG: PEGA domain-containing protein, partial [Myxococcaceae bacterium]|nr:PEGA domain-containing protein [Myxococcaceae bacterium]
PPEPVVVKPDPVPTPKPIPDPPPPPPLVVAEEPKLPVPAPAPVPPVKHAPTGPAEVRCITTTPDGDASWAYVDLDGIRRGTTPLTLKLPPGEHELVFRRPGFATQTRKVTTTAGELKRVSVELKP